MPPALAVSWLPRDPRPADWRSAPLHALVPVAGDAPPATTFRILAAPAALHLRIDCVATRLTCRMENDGDPLYLEDVVEVFLGPAGRDPALYLEYEVSPRGRDLLLLVACAADGTRSAWRSWALAPERRPSARVRTRGGAAVHGARVRGWSADIRLPWALFAGLGGRPAPGAEWRGNLFRIDHAGGRPAHAAWAALDRAAFHQPARFGRIRF
jgi:hypothetical protein